MTAAFFIDVRLDASKIERALLRLAPELRDKATAQVIGRTAALVRKEIVAELPKIFDRPTPWTLNSIRYAVAADGQAATLYVTDDRSKGISAQNFLRAEIMGGGRKDKRSEKALLSRGLLAAGAQVAPGNSGELDRFGNLRAGLIVQALSGIGAMHEMGFVANATARSRARAKRAQLAHASTGTRFFVGKVHGAAPGVYEVLGRHHVRAVMHFIARPAYKARFNLQGLTNRFAAKIVPVQVRRVFHEIAEGSLHL